MGKDADKENNRNKFKKVLLSCLNDADVRDAILSIQNSAPVMLDDSKLRDLEYDLQESQHDLRNKERELEKMQRQYQSLQGELADYKGMLTKAQNENIVLSNDKKKMQQSIDSIAGENKHLKSELSSTKSELQGVCSVS